jgi:pimeloyl-ACP methyl ester carboxylesterase
LAFRQVLNLLSICAPRLTVRLVEKLFFTPGSYSLSVDEQRRLEQGESFHFQVHDRRICGWRWGNGPGVLLVHGWNGSGIQFHRFIDPLVQAGYTAIAIDGPSHGASEGRSTSYFEFTDVVRALIEPSRGFCVRGVVAHSFGAAAVVNGLVHQKAALKTVLLAPALKLRELLFNAFDQHGIPRRIYENIIAAYEARFGYSLERDDPHLRLNELRSPVLVIHDQDDPVIAYRDSQALCRRYEQMTLKTTYGLGHKNIMTDPVVVDATVSHLRELRGSAPRVVRSGTL